ncbi:MAG: hypothetical protein IJ225_04785 [Solobacterium sp.]|nr:hypothetical protein [Solobacterium sp.]
MRRMLVALIFCLLFAGCSRASEDAGSMAAYEGYYKAIQDNDRFQERSLYYSLSGELVTLSDRTHRYYVFLDDAQIAMYDVVLLAVENHTAYEDADHMMPSIGVFESTEYSLIPYQSRADAGFVKGLVLSGECDSDEVELDLLVEWRDKNKENAHREYLELTLTKDGFLYTEEEVEDAEEQLDE